MCIRREALFALLIAPIACADARAQDSLPARPVVGHVAAGYAEPLRDAGDFFEGGWDVSAGATFHFSPEIPVGLRLDLGYSRFDARNQVLESNGYPRRARVDDGALSVTRLTADVLWEFGRTRVGGYVGAGLGGYQRRVEITTTVLIGQIDCDPIFPICFVTGAGDVLETDDQVMQIGWNLGAAVRFPLPSRGGDLRRGALASDRV